MTWIKEAMVMVNPASFGGKIFARVLDRMSRSHGKYLLIFINI